MSGGYRSDRMNSSAYAGRQSGRSFKAADDGQAPPRTPYVLARSVPCPTCDVPEGEACVTSAGKAYKAGSHRARHRMAVRAGAIRPSASPRTSSKVNPYDKCPDCGAVVQFRAGKPNKHDCPGS